MWTTYPQTHILLKENQSCTSLKITKSSSRWWSKDEVKHWDTCPELTELRLIVDRIHLEPKIQIKYVDTKNQFADMLTKRRKFHTWWVESSSSIVQHYEFLDVLLQPLQQLSFWSNQKAERRVKERQEVTSSEGPPIAKPKPMIPAMAKTMNLLLHNPLMKNEAVIPSWCGLYQAKIQSNFLKWCDRKTLNMQTPGNKETGMNLRARPAPGNWCGRWTQRRLSITRWSPIINTWRMFSNICRRSWESQQVNICNGSTEERQMCWYGDCSCLRQWKQPLILDNVEVYKNTNFEKIQNLFNITQKLTLEHSEIDS